MRVKTPIINSRYVKPDHLTTGHIWTEDGLKYKELYGLLSVLKVINYKKVLKDYL